MSTFYLRFQAIVNAFTKRNYWKLYLAVLCSLYCILSNTPPYKVLNNGQTANPAVWNRINRQIEHPLTPDFSNDPQSHEAKLTFRLVPPLFGKLFPVHDLFTRLKILFLIQNLCGLLFFYLLISFAEANVGNRVFSFLLPCCFAVIYAGKTFFFDTQFFFDGLAYFFLLASICSRNPLLVFGSLLAAFYTDERSLVASGFVLLYHLLQARPDASKRILYCIVGAVLVYIATRLCMQSLLGMRTPSGDVGPLGVIRKTPLNFISLGLFTAFKSYWLVVVLGIFCLGGFWPRLIYCSTLAVLLIGSVSVFDFSRSMSYGFVGLLVVLVSLYKEQKNADWLNKLVLLLFITSFLNPLYGVFGQDILINNPVIGKFLHTS